ncbi:hypothetical protein [uncultured Arcticibacterium sp.]|uniref:family 16 glycoside hydrolase n=1 Tax=uncultured Arcticibacterium sp. TaxID=2173042 RepID=UPI0030F61592
MKKLITLTLLVAVVFSGVAQSIDLKPENFDFKEGSVEFLNYKGRQSMKIAPNANPIEIKNLNFKNGTIEYDMEPITGGFSSSVYFHRQDDKEQEIVYLRVFKMNDKLANEAIQYAPYIDGVNMWDMLPQYQAASEIKPDWNHIKLVISGKRMKVYCNKKEVLNIPELEGRMAEGKIAFDGNSYISNLIVKPNATEGLHPEALPDLTDHQSNFIRNWAMTSPMLLPKGTDITTDNLPDNGLFEKSISAERMGLINLTKVYGKSTERRVIWLKAVVESSIAKSVELELGFSDELWVFLNNKMVYVDKNLYMQDMKKYPRGRISTENGSVRLNLKEGKNEITMAVANDFYGWGIIARLKTVDDLLSIEKFTPIAEVSIENIKQYLGTYTTKDMPIKISITETEGKLIAQATNQEPLDFKYIGNHVFVNEKENIKLTFNMAESKVILTEGGNDYSFLKK